MSESTQNLNQLLREIEQELQEIDLWSEQQPDDCAMHSTVPFCYDTMPFENWVQWIMIPTFDEILSKDGALPGYCEISPMAELAFAEITEKADQLIGLIQQLDELIKSQSAVVN